MDDIPMILSSISWQLKRIADVMESDNQIDEREYQTESPKIRELLEQLRSNKG
jgi:hypothetical protein